MNLVAETMSNPTEEIAALAPREEFSRLFLDNPRYEEPSRTILDAVDRKDAFAASYLRIFPRLLRASEEFSQIFPPELATGVKIGNRELISDALDSVAYHTDHANATEAAIPLRGGRELPVVFNGSQPAEDLTALLRQMTRISGVMNDPDTLVVKAVDRHDFRIYRFIDVAHPGQMAVHAYIRPEGDEVFDPMYEYGRQNVGVEASISLVGDSRSGEALAGKPFLGEITKAHYGSKPDNRISLRLDREGVRPDDRENLDSYRHPQLPDGTLAYDAGSVLGSPTIGTLPLGTRVGRLLGWGNYLASQRSGGHVGLNHSTTGFHSRLGRHEIFAQHAEAFEATIAARTVSRTQLARMFGKSAMEKML